MIATSDLLESQEDYLRPYQQLSVIDDESLQRLVAEISRVAFGREFQHQAIFNRRLRTTGGRYHLSSHDLDFNPKVYERYGLPELVNVIKHELCHYHLHLTGRGYQHRDADFKKLLAKTGGSRFVKPLIEQAPENYIQYQCQKCQTLILRKRKINTKRYGCRCGGRLKKV